MPNPHLNLSRPLLSILLAAALLAGSGAGHAGDAQDHERARQALAAGEILPLHTVLAQVEREHPGQVMEVELERRRTGWVYEVKLLQSGGALIKLKIDARSGAVLGSKEKERR